MSGDDDAAAGGRRAGSRAVLVAAGILLSRLAGFAREALVARFLGVGAFADVYGTAMRLPNLLQNLLGEQTLSAAFIPAYSRMVHEGRRGEAGRFAGAAAGLLLVAAGGLALLGVIAARPIVAVFAAGYLRDAEKVAAGALPVDRFAVTVDLVRIAFPMAGVLVLSAWALGVLNSHRRFFLPYAAPVLWNAAIIAALLWWGGHVLSGRVDAAAKTRLLHVVAWAALAGAALQLLVQLPVVARLLTGFRLSLGREVPGVPEALRALGPVVAGRGVVQLSGYLDGFLAALLAAGAVSAQRYAMTLYMLPISLFAMSVAAAELPELSRLQREGDEARLRRVEAGVRQIAFLTLPTFVGFLVFGWLLVGLVFRGREFGAQDQALVALTLAGYTLGLLPTTIARLLQNLFYSLDETRWPARVATARVTVSAAIGAALMIWLDRFGVASLLVGAPRGDELRLGAVGLALGSAVGGWLELALLLRGARRLLPGAALPWRPLARMGALAITAAAPAAALWWLLFEGRWTSWPGWPAALAVLALYAVAYLGGAVALRFPETRAWLGRLR